jgi:hypothetical protein
MRFPTFACPDLVGGIGQNSAENMAFWETKMRKSIALALFVLMAAITLGCDGGGGTSLVTSTSTSKENLPQAPRVPAPE